MLRTCATLSVVLGSLFLVGCGSDTGIACGQDTHQQGNQCVADARDGGPSTFDAAPAPLTDGAAPPDSASPSPVADASPDAAPEAGPPVHDGDPCPKGTASVCSGNHLFDCQLANNGAHPLGTLWDSQDCSLLNGMCAVDLVGNGNCTGGGYTSCVRPVNDAGNGLDTRTCYSADVLEECNGAGWSPIDCKKSGLVCKAIPGGGANCVAP